MSALLLAGLAVPVSWWIVTVLSMCVVSGRADEAKAQWRRR